MASLFNKGKQTASSNAPGVKSKNLQAALETRMNQKLIKTSSFGLESLVSAVYAENNDVSPDLVDAESQLRASVEEAYGEGAYNELSDCQRDAGLYALAGQRSIRGAMETAGRSAVAVTPGVASVEGYGVVSNFGMPFTAGAAAPFDYQVERRQPSNEEFDDRKLDGYVRTSVGFHILAARQTAAAEALYPGFALPPDANGFEIEVERPLVFNQIWHDNNGNTTDWNRHRKLLLNAFQDYTILQNTATRIKPYWAAGNADNNAMFIDNSVVPATPYGATAEESFTTSWFKPGAKFSLVGAGLNPEFAKLGTPNTTDTIDHMVMLDKVLMRVETASGVSFIPVNTRHMAYSGFNPAGEGQHRKLVLTFAAEDIAIHAATLDVNGAAPVALTTLATTYANYRVLMSVDINGKINLANSETSIQAAEGNVSSVLKVTGTGIDAVVTEADAAMTATIKALFTSITFVGYKLEAYLTNFNRAIHGPLVTQERYKDIHSIPLGAPITAQLPVVDTANANIDVTSPANTLMVRNSNNAFSQLFTFEAILEQAQLAATGHNATVPQIRAIGRFLLKRPWMAKEAIVLTDEVNSLSTSNRNADNSAAICNKLRIMLNVGYYHTNMQAAMDVLGLSAGQKPKVVLVCNPIVANYIWEKGDSRTLGDGWAFDIVPDQDMRLIDRDANGNPVYRIYAVFKVAGVDGPHPLNFGNMIYKPDLATQLPITRDNRTTVEFTVQPWTLHVNHCPVMFRLDIHGLKEAASESMPIQTNFV